jgi:hypothetical protein
MTTLGASVSSPRLRHKQDYFLNSGSELASLGYQWHHWSPYVLNFYIVSDLSSRDGILGHHLSQHFNTSAYPFSRHGRRTLQLWKHHGYNPRDAQAVGYMLLVHSHQDSHITTTNYHSSNCRRAGSSIGSLVYVSQKSDVQITDPRGNLKSYDDGDTTSGNHIIRQFCGNCGW